MKPRTIKVTKLHEVSLVASPVNPQCRLDHLRGALAALRELIKTMDDSLLDCDKLRGKHGLFLTYEQWLAVRDRLQAQELPDLAFVPRETPTGKRGRRTKG